MPYIEHIFYRDEGAGIPVLFIHCPALDHTYWRPSVDHLMGICRCISFDIRGHGQSGKGTEPWGFADIAEDVALLTERLNLRRPILVGYSSGACIALQTALDYPDKFGALVLVSAFSECTTTRLRAKVLIGLAAVRLGLARHVGRKLVITNNVGEDHAQAMLRQAQGVRPQALRSFLRAALRFNVTRRLPEIKVPVLLVYGASDRILLPHYRILRSGLPNVQAVLFPATDHRVPTRRPAEFAKLLAAFRGSLERPTARPQPESAVAPRGIPVHQYHDTPDPNPGTAQEIEPTVRPF